jgi:pyridoxamine 5'-phosphate oxidase family protein
MAQLTDTQVRYLSTQFRDVRATRFVAIVIDDLASVDPWRPRMVEIRGRAEVIPDGDAPGMGGALIRIYPDKVNSAGV